MIIDNTHVSVTRRGNSWLPEVSLAPGPADEALAGGGSYQELYSHQWALILFVDGSLRLYRATGTEWQERPLLPIPHDTREIRHIALAWDQQARPVLAYEHGGQVFVRQWDASAQVFVMRGPWPGVDPALIMDATVNKWMADSDVHLYHLNPERTTLFVRVQRELYATAHAVHTSSIPMILDQAVPASFQVQVLGATEAAEDDTGVIRTSNLYPYNAPPIGLLFTGAFTSGTYNQVAHHYSQQQSLSLSGAFVGGVYASTNVNYNQEQRLSLSGSFTAGAYTQVVTSYSQQQSLSLSGAFVAGAYTHVATQYSQQQSLSLSGAFVGGVYAPA